MDFTLGGLPAVFVALVAGLGNPQFRVRERCHRLLAHCGELAWPALRQGQNSKDPEVVQRCRLLEAPLRRAHAWQLAGNYKPTRYPRIPWLCLQDNVNPWWNDVYGGKMTDFYRTRAAKEKGAANVWPNHEAERVATRLWVADRIIAGWLDMEIVAALDRMADIEIRWILDRRANGATDYALPPGFEP